MLKSDLAQTISIIFETPVGDKGLSVWGEHKTFEKSYENIGCIVDVVDNLNIERYRWANVKIGTVIFYISNDVDLDDKLNITVEWNGKRYRVETPINHQPLGDAFMAKMLVQRST